MTPIIEFTATDTQQILSYAGSTIAGLMPLIVIIFGVGIAVWFLGGIFHRK